MSVGRRDFQWLASLVFVGSVYLAGCVAIDDAAKSQGDAWLRDGSILLSRSAPPAPALKPAPLLGFVPTRSSTEVLSPSIVIDRTSGTLSLPGSTESLPVRVPSDLAQGTHPVLLKQMNPLWYAPDSYYAQRGMLLPPSGDRVRYLRGALGTHAIFLGDNFALHSAPLWTENVGGVQLNADMLQSLFARVQVGALVEIR